MGQPNSLNTGFRAKRMGMLLERFPDLAHMEVVDLGGTVRTWTRSPVRPAHVHLINPEPPVKGVADDVLPDWVTMEIGDACDLPAHLRERRFDLVFSNSVMEHVGGHERRARFADSVHMLSDRHWVQVPYLYFPVEPHWVFPLFQFLPLPAQTAIAARWPLSAWGKRPRSRAEALPLVMEVELMSRTQMRHYFPGSDLIAERFAGLTKSLIACRAS
ncbi:class I SAM-dependent methyltransferase [Sphaerisporangium album]|uniref:Class I SAM-dependent methyltransferase n=1 Tax=Sphaerisporangium album TaxID=509200 RepID=A0A367FL20_9ACTN|nr:class I SAM-dependent methyltransferase [Sphaerisporangium album]